MLLVVTFLAFVSYAALLPVVPLWAAHGGAASAVVGSTTGVMMGATVLAQCAAPVLFKYLGLRQMTMIGAVLLGGPTPLYILSDGAAWILSITAVRGLGFALVVISGATLVVVLSRGGRLASSASLYGAAAALPNIGALAGGVWAADTWGFSTVFWTTGLASIAAAFLAIWLPARTRGNFTMIGLSEIGRIAAPASIFLLTAAGFGAMTTFLPVAGPTAVEASWVLLTASLALIAGRLAAGMLGDRIGGGRVLITTVLITGLGLALISQALPHQSALLITGACLLGLGFGAGQNDSFVVIVQRLGPERSATASTLWNMAYDGGLGLGAITLGWVIGSTGYADAFLIAAFAIALFGLLIHLIAPGHRTRR